MPDIDQKPGKKTRFIDWESLHSRTYILADRVWKRIQDKLDDVYTIFFQAFTFVVKSLVIVYLGVLRFSMSRKPGYLQVPLNLAKAALGLVLSFVGFLFGTISLLFFGSFGGILGFRNLGEYSLREQLVAWLVALAAIVAVPFVFPEYTTFRIGMIFAYAVGVLGLDFLFGLCGIISLGHSGFMLLGGYTTIWACNAGLPPLVAVGCAGLAMIPIGVILGLPSLRVKDHYLVIITMTFALAIPKIMKSQYMSKYSGLREGGLFLRDIQIPEFLAKVPPHAISYFMIVIPAMVLFYAAYNINHHTQIGRAFKTIKCDNEVSMIMGIPVVWYKLLAFALSAVYAGLSAGFLVLQAKFISPDNYVIMDSINAIAANVIGGPASLLGSIFGGAFLTYNPDFSQKMAELIPRGKDVAQALYGILMIVVIFMVPGGVAVEIAGWFKQRLHKSVRRGAFQANPPPDFEYFQKGNRVLKRQHLE